jgi:hypothetical protein
MYQQFPSNQTGGVTPNPLAPAVKTPNPPIAQIHRKAIDGTAIQDGFRRVGTDIVTQQVPGFIHRLLHSIVDVLIPGNAYSPYIGRSHYGYPSYPVVQGPATRMAQMPAYGQRIPPAGYMPQQPVAEILSQRRAFDTFTLSDPQTAAEVFEQLMLDSMNAGALTVAQVYDRLGIQNVSFMAVSYHWTPDDFAQAVLIALPDGRCNVKMPKAHLSSNV